jgi:NADPH-dependent 2,4-dienoyl-CoA reductase/sulfur reductase-like enzyme
MGTKLLIIGGVAGGATAAARARRLEEGAEIILFERGSHISYANCGLPYYIGEVIGSGDDLLVTTAQAFSERYNIEVRVCSEVTAIDRQHKHVVVRDLNTGDICEERYDKLILAPGAEPIKPPFEGVEVEAVFDLRTIPDAQAIKHYTDAKNPDSAVIVGGGYIGLEMAENLTRRGVKTTLIEMLDQVMVSLDYEMAAIVHAHLKEKGVACVLGNRVTSLSEENGRMSVSTDGGYHIECDMVISSIGIAPENKLARDADLAIGTRGGIVVDATMRTSDPHIYGWRRRGGQGLCHRSAHHDRACRSRKQTGPHRRGQRPGT